eukprot:NODE_12815_length_1202_cov_2.386977.p1 GENE.NODE_12815_length_1202_cov_2.386977~~NODE_12815_length_1202_cov_2.386977.p1  ORF type:complete len:318 (-),score=39.24 NODE_12815_length_1202_cov_2.386977:150-1103(-)
MPRHSSARADHGVACRGAARQPPHGLRSVLRDGSLHRPQTNGGHAAERKHPDRARHRERPCSAAGRRHLPKHCGWAPPQRGHRTTCCVRKDWCRAAVPHQTCRAHGSGIASTPHKPAPSDVTRSCPAEEARRLLSRTVPRSAAREIAPAASKLWRRRRAHARSWGIPARALTMRWWARAPRQAAGYRAGRRLTPTTQTLLAHVAVGVREAMAGPHTSRWGALNARPRHVALDATVPRGRHTATRRADCAALCAEGDSASRRHEATAPPSTRVLAPNASMGAHEALEVSGASQGSAATRDCRPATSPTAAGAEGTAVT